ncbi:Fras1-Related Extracellular Matrix Protein 2 [Manis pentadactyla]|nr:Fras1-Related Extracellular Matrix Protein 2 [Manis pentadactyla]
MNSNSPAIKKEKALQAKELVWRSRESPGGREVWDLAVPGAELKLSLDLIYLWPLPAPKQKKSYRGPNVPWLLHSPSQARARLNLTWASPESTLAAALVLITGSGALGSRGLFT